MTNIFDAIEKRDLELVKTLIEAGANLEEYNDDGLLPIHLAAINNNFDMVKLLIENGADINAEFSVGGTLAHIAAGQFGPDQLDWLLANGMDINAEFENAYPINMAAMAGSLENVKWFFDKGVQDENIKGPSVLHSATFGRFDELLVSIKKGVFISEGLNRISDELLPKYLRLLSYLLEERVCDINTQSDEGTAPLSFAARSGNIHIMDFLKERGADVYQDVEHSIHDAAFEGCIEVIKWFEEKGFNIKDIKYNNMSAMSAAAQAGQVKVMEYLLETGANLHDLDGYGSSLMHNAVAGDNPEVIECLLKKGLDINIPDAHGSTPECYAVLNGKIRSLKYLAERGSDINLENLNLRSNPKLTIELIQWLQSKGYDIKKEGHSLMHCTAYHGQTDIVEYLLSEGLDVNVKNEEGKTPIYYATKKGRFKAIKYLHERGADLGARDNDGNTLMHIAARKGRMHIIQWLVDHDIPVDFPNLQGKTPVNSAAQKGRLKVIEFLGKKGGDISNIESYAQDLIEYAAVQRDTKLVEHIKERGVDISDLNFVIGTRLKTSPSKIMKASEWITQYGVEVIIPGNELEFLMSNQGVTKVDEWIQKNKIVVNINAADSYGYTLIHKAIQMDNIEMFQWCIRNNANFNLGNNYGYTPLFQAISDNKYQYVKLLLEHGVDTNVLNHHGTTPLLNAIYGNKTEMIALLCGFKANIDLTNWSVRDYFTNQDKFQQLLTQGTLVEQIIAGLYILDSLKADDATRVRGIELEQILVEKINLARPDILDHPDLLNTRTNLKAILINLDKCKALEGLEEKIQDFDHESPSFESLGFLTAIRESELNQKLASKERELMAVATNVENDGSAMSNAMHNAGVRENITSFLSREDQVNLFVSPVAHDDQTDKADELAENPQVETTGEE